MSKHTSWIIIVMITLIVIGGIIWYSFKPGIYDTFAACIKESGATFYGAFWCPHCQNQKKMFGKSAGKLPYIECSTPNGQGQLSLCQEAKIETYPTWQFKDGSRKTGVISLEELSTITTCPIIKDQS